MNLKIIKKSFILGLISRDEIINWSDGNLMKGNTDEFFVKLSSLNSKDSDRSLIDLLDEFDNSKNEIQSIEQFHLIYLSHIYTNFSEWKEIQKEFLKYYQVNKKFLDQKEYEFWSRLKDDFELRREGFVGGCMKMPEEINNYFSFYKIKKSNTSFFQSLINFFNF